MIGTLARIYAYKTAPRVALALMHPRKSVRLAKVRWDFRHAAAPRIAAVGAAVGTAALTLPLGLMLGRRGRVKRDG